MSLFVFLKSKSFRFYTIIIILALQGHQCETKRNLDVYITLFSYTMPQESDAIVQTNFSLNSIEGMQSNSSAKSKLKTHPAVYISAKEAYDITDIRVGLDISVERSGRYDKYLSTEVDFCKMRHSKVAQPLIRYFRDELIRVVEPKEFCPIKKNSIFELNNFMLSNSILPAYAPALNWKVDVKLWLNGRYAMAFVGMGKLEWIDT